MHGRAIWSRRFLLGSSAEDYVNPRHDPSHRLVIIQRNSMRAATERNSAGGRLVFAERNSPSAQKYIPCMSKWLLAIRLVSDNTSLRSEEHTSELQSLMRTSYALFCFTKQTHHTTHQHPHHTH